MSQLSREQAGALLEYLDGHFEKLGEHYEEGGYSDDRADNALDELAGIRDGMRSSALSPVDAALMLGFVDGEALGRPDIVEALEAVIYA
ncbi:MAG: hypothetical protein ACRDC7_19810 [Aeromonas veronii]